MRAREIAIWAMFSRWFIRNTEKKYYNGNVWSDIYLVFKSITQNDKLNLTKFLSCEAFQLLIRIEYKIINI